MKFLTFVFSLLQILHGKESSHACLSSCTAGQLLQSIFYQAKEAFRGRSLQAFKSLSPHNFGALYLKLSRTWRFSFSSSTASLREYSLPRKPHLLSTALEIIAPKSSSRFSYTFQPFSSVAFLQENRNQLVPYRCPDQVLESCRFTRRGRQKGYLLSNANNNR